jgi:hypothetical protein
MEVDSRIIVIASLYILKFLFGFWLFKTGKPYGTIMLTIHKLLSLAILGYLVFIVNRVRLDTGLSTMEWSLTTINILLLLFSIVSGGILSLDKPVSRFISLVHKIVPIFSVIAIASILFLLF